MEPLPEMDGANVAAQPTTNTEHVPTFATLVPLLLMSNPGVGLLHVSSEPRGTVDVFLLSGPSPFDLLVDQDLVAPQFSKQTKGGLAELAHVRFDPLVDTELVSPQVLSQTKGVLAELAHVVPLPEMDGANVAAQNITITKHGPT